VFDTAKAPAAIVPSSDNLGLRIISGPFWKPEDRREEWGSVGRTCEGRYSDKERIGLLLIFHEADELKSYKGAASFCSAFS